MNQKAHSLNIAILAVGLIWTTGSQAQMSALNCSDILAGGYFEVAEHEQDDAAANQLTNWYASSFSQQDRTGGSEAGDAALGIGGFKVGGNLSKDYHNNHDLQSSIAAFQHHQAAEQHRLGQFAKTVSPIIVDAWRHCMEQMGIGLKVSLKWTGDPNAFYLMFRYDSDDPIHHPVAKILAFNPRASVTCDPAVNRMISNSPVAIYCVRSANVATSVDWQTDVKPTFPLEPIFSIPSVPIITADTDIGPFGKPWAMSRIVSTKLCKGRWSLSESPFSCAMRCEYKDPATNGGGPFARPYDRTAQCTARYDSTRRRIHIDYSSPVQASGLRELACTFDGNVTDSTMEGTSHCGAGEFQSDESWTARADPGPF